MSAQKQRVKQIVATSLIDQVWSDQTESGLFEEPLSKVTHCVGHISANTRPQKGS